MSEEDHDGSKVPSKGALFNLEEAIAKLNLPEMAGLKKALEEAGLKRALEEVRAHAAGYKESGLSPLSFFTGLINIALSSFLLGRAPEWYWVWSVSHVSHHVLAVWPQSRSARFVCSHAGCAAAHEN